jgi:rubrerythrin
MTREEAIKILRDTPIDIRSTREDDIHTLYATAQCMAIEALSAEAVQGEWIGSYECSVCGKQAFDFIEGYVDGVEYLPKFCPNCGAKMNGGKE